MSTPTPTVETLSAEIVELRAQIEALKAQVEELKARPVVAARAQQPARPAQKVLAEGDGKGRTPNIYARDAQRVLSNHSDPHTKCWVTAKSPSEYTLRGFSAIPQDFVFSVETLNNLVRWLRSGKDAASYLASMQAPVEDTPPWEEAA